MIHRPLPPSYVPVLVTQDQPLVNSVVEVDRSQSVFRTQGVGRPRDVKLVPFHRLHERRYSVYLDVVSPEEWTQREAAIRARQQRQRQLDARTVDQLRIADAESERQHNLQGEKTGTGEHLGRTWRHAVDGGWFSFDMKVADTPHQLLCTYWGSETGPRTFDILIDGKAVAQQSLRNDKPGEFFDVSYPVPADLTRGKSKVTVKFQGQPGNFAGGLFGCRMLRSVSDKPIKVLIIGGQNNHDWMKSTPFMKAVLDNAGHFQAVVDNAPGQKATQDAWDAWRPKFGDFDSVVLDYNGEMWPEEVGSVCQIYPRRRRGGGYPRGE